MIDWQDAHMEVWTVVSAAALGACFLWEYMRPAPKVQVVKKVGKTFIEADESGISSSFIKKLIGQSNNKADLQKIYQYLSDYKKTYNLTNGERGSLINSVRSKLNEINDREMLHEIYRTIKKGTSCTDHLMDWLSHMI